MTTKPRIAMGLVALALAGSCSTAWSSSASASSFAQRAVDTVTSPEVQSVGGPAAATVQIEDASEIGPDRATAATAGVFVNGRGAVIGGWKRLLPGENGEMTTPGTPQQQLNGESEVGGGRWKYGSYRDASNYHHCWSFYYNKFRSHHATAQWVLSRHPDTEVAGLRVAGKAGQWANAELVPNKNDYTCLTFWGNDS